MRQYDRTGPVSKGVGRGQKGLELRVFGRGHGIELCGRFVLRVKASGAGKRKSEGWRGRLPRVVGDSYAPVFRKCRQRVIATLLFVRRNDILLQCGMALQVVPLPSLGVSSLDLGRSFNRAALFLYCAVGYSAAARGMASPGTPATSARTMASRSPRSRSNPADFSKLVSSI
jgi:hypothetical protein